ncbi:hypothetical protein [Extensimonas sp. H3M7-6]|uniref:hypothetical protein n=1 Tax=Extensimonas soli TaxID=3031322 RepID=UPI0023DC2E7D|nr:hypothetical protein [Extensimonas sp. H3M7-6]MDF1483337.1 hypothetical protein [Extensimonas sp. H3M7-6]
MNVTAFVEKLQRLPEDKQVELLDYLDYLSARFAAPVSLHLDTWGERDFARLALDQAMRDMEDEVGLYSEEDLKERWS